MRDVLSKQTGQGLASFYRTATAINCLAVTLIFFPVFAIQSETTQQSEEA